MDKLIDLESIKDIIDSVVKENSLTDDEIIECGAACGCGTTTTSLGSAVQYLGDTKKKQDESSLAEEDEMNEMARGILAPQEIAKREYATEYPESGIKTADQFLRKVINNPEAPGYDKYVKRLGYLIKNASNGSFSNIAAEVSLDNGDNSDDYALTKTYADALLNHRKSMSKSSYDSKGLINAYQRNIIKRGPYYKPGRDMPIQQDSIGKMISDKYNEVDPKESNKVLASFLKGNEWNSLDDSKKIKELGIIKDEADLDEIGFNIISKEEGIILDRLIGDDE